MFVTLNSKYSFSRNYSNQLSDFASHLFFRKKDLLNKALLFRQLIILGMGRQWPGCVPLLS